MWVRFGDDFQERFMRTGIEKSLRIVRPSRKKSKKPTAPLPAEQGNKDEASSGGNKTSTKVPAVSRKGTKAMAAMEVTQGSSVVTQATRGAASSPLASMTTPHGVISVGDVVECEYDNTEKKVPLIQCNLFRLWGGVAYSHAALAGLKVAQGKGDGD